MTASLWLHARGQEADPPPGDGSPPGPPGQQNSIHIEGSNNGAISIMNVNRVPAGLLFGVAALAAAAISVLVVSLDVRHSPEHLTPATRPDAVADTRPDLGAHRVAAPLADTPHTAAQCRAGTIRWSSAVNGE